MIIDNPAKRIILKLVKNYRSSADKRKEDDVPLTFFLDKSPIKDRITNLVFSTPGTTSGYHYRT
jgi:hypothetical protein